MLSIFVLASALTSAQEANEIDSAQEALRRARASLSEAREELEHEYRALEEAFTTLRKDAGDRFFADVHRAIETIQPRLNQHFQSLRKEAEDTRGRPPRRRDVVDGFRALIADRLGSNPILLESLQKPLVDALAKSLGEDALKENPNPKSAVDEAIRISIDPKVRFHEAWNASIYASNHAATSYAAAYDSYSIAGAQLQRLRKPTRFLPGGKKIRPGMAYIEGGTYEVGPGKGFVQKQRKVNLVPFLLDQYEVSNAAYRVYFDALDPEEQRKRLPHGWTIDETGKVSVEPSLADHPVTGISWVDANEFAKAVGKRLPTEWEWEVAASGREHFLYPWGNKFDPSRCNHDDTGLETTAPCGSFNTGASPYGCHDMAGNVTEWTDSDPDGGAIKNISSSLTRAVIRGGGYNRGEDFLSTRFRWIAAIVTRDKYIGFRCAADIR